MRIFIGQLLCGLLCTVPVFGQRFFMDPKVHHLRVGDVRQWAEFADQPEGESLTLTFDAQVNKQPASLFIRHYSVLLEWQVVLNDQVLGTLSEDEKDMISSYEVPAGVLRNGANKLQVLPSKKTSNYASNDIRVGEIFIDGRPLSSVLSESSLEVEIRNEANQLMPSRMTITDDRGGFMPILASDDPLLAIRPGVVYTGNGRVKVRLPAGTYRLFATRGFEYGVDSARITVKPGEHVKKQFRIKKEVATAGWVSSDTHIHTFTHSRHGDASDEERVITIAGEGIELPIITDHNQYADLAPVAKEKGLSPFFTVVNGIEFTTPVGHFNLFPVDVKAPMIDYKVKSWDELAVNVAKSGVVKGIILNHARDTHSKFRPFDSSRHLASAGTTLTGWQFPANAMEVINSGATQSDPMRLFQDWFGMLNRGYSVTPVGSTDTHTVSRYLLGQARTYIRAEDRDPSRIDIENAISQFRKGKVMVSFGLLTEMVVNKMYQSGDTVRSQGKGISVAIRVSGPGWTTADRVSLYANGKKIKEARIENGQKAGLKWSQVWNLPALRHDVYLVAIAEGPGEVGPFWQIAKPYQATSPIWVPRVMGASGAVFIDADRDKRWSSANAYAQKLVNASKENIQTLIQKLSVYDEAVAVQAASILQAQGHSFESFSNDTILSQASAEARAGFKIFAQEYQISQAQP